MADIASSGKGDLGKRLAHKALMPIVATAASAAAGFVAKKGPSFFEQTVLPKLKQLGGGAGDAVSSVPAKAKQVVGGGSSDDESETGNANGNARSNGNGGAGLSQDDLEKHVKERAEARAARRKPTKKGS